jgi:hypothetical protein
MSDTEPELTPEEAARLKRLAEEEEAARQKAEQDAREVFPKPADPAS